MKANAISQRGAAREFNVDRARIRSTLTDRGVKPIGRQGGHLVYDRTEVRRVLGLELYGSATALTSSCDECWGPLAHHENGMPCPPGWYEYSSDVRESYAARADRVLRKEYVRRQRALRRAK